MRILVYGLNYYPELTGIGKYNTEMCEWLAARNHDVRVISAPPYYPEWKVNKNYSSWLYRIENHNNVKIYRSPLFVPKNPKLLSRILHLLTFAVSSFPILIWQIFWRPNIVITIEPTLFCTPGALIFSLFSRAKTVLHIQDFEIDAMLGLGMTNKSILTSFAEKVECWLMKKFYLISSISNKMCEHARAKLNNKNEVYLFPNWADINFINPDEDALYYRKLWNIPKSTIVLLYAGNLGKKQGLNIIIDAAYQLQHSVNCIFIVVGSGAHYNELVIKANELKLSNIRFYPLQRYCDLPKLMLLADLHLIIQRKGLANVVLPSKLTSILSSGGTSLITTESGTELGDLCENYPEIAIQVKPENISAFTGAITRWCKTFDFKNKSSNNTARKYAEIHIDKEKILADFETKLLSLI